MAATAVTRAQNRAIAKVSVCNGFVRYSLAVCSLGVRARRTALGTFLPPPSGSFDKRRRFEHSILWPVTTNGIFSETGYTCSRTIFNFIRFFTELRMKKISSLSHRYFSSVDRFWSLRLTLDLGTWVISL